VKPAPFEYFRPKSLGDALELLDRHAGKARLIAGGQSLVPMMNLRIARPEILIDLGAVQDLVGISALSDRVSIGAMTLQSALLTDAVVCRHLPLLACAAGHIGHFQTRSRGTLGGSLAQADSAAELSLIAVTLDATLKLQSTNGTRTIAARDFFVDALTTVIVENEILTEVSFPTSPADTVYAFDESARRHGDFAIASVAVERSPAQKRVLVGVGAVGSTPHFCATLSASLSERGFDSDTIEPLIAEEFSGIEPITDLTASSEYRRHIGMILLKDSLELVFQK
jgi:aerobic carbon-monoxide dehydrogenase medium subunit